MWFNLISQEGKTKGWNTSRHVFCLNLLSLINEAAVNKRIALAPCPLLRSTFILSPPLSLAGPSCGARLIFHTEKWSGKTIEEIRKLCSVYYQRTSKSLFTASAKLKDSVLINGWMVRIILNPRRCMMSMVSFIVAKRFSSKVKSPISVCHNSFNNTCPVSQNQKNFIDDLSNRKTIEGLVALETCTYKLRMDQGTKKRMWK